MQTNAALPGVTIEWVNHASFIVSAGGMRLLCDPWLTGSAFNNGWRHVTPTRFSAGDFGSITHVWISHQHPDHFAPGDLKSVPPEVRAGVTVLYQTVPDKLVVSWLKSAGYKGTRELPMQQWVRLNDDTELLCGSLDDDSWLAVRTGALTLLNVNDCVLKRAEDIADIKRLVGQVDVLFTQFSYAQWIGNPEDTQRRKADAAEKFARIRLQCRILNPQYVVPFASFIYFSNTENFFMNDAMNRVGSVASFIEEDLGKRAVVLYPGERWKVGEPADWRAAAQRYDADVRARLDAGPVDVPRTVGREQFVSYVNDFLKRLRRKNPLFSLFMREETTFYLTDHEQAFRLGPKGVRAADAGARESDIATCSENVLYAFRTPWGGNTLHVSGRFQSYVPGGHLRFFRVMSQLHYYNRTAIDLHWVAAQCARVPRGVSRRLARLTRRAAQTV